VGEEPSPPSCQGRSLLRLLRLSKSHPLERLGRALTLYLLVSEDPSWKEER